MDVIYALVVFVSTLISVSVLGLAAGFSPTLYIAQVAITSKVKRPVAYTTSLMSGVLGAIFILILLFQVIQLDALLAFLNSTLHAAILSVAFNVLVGGGFIIGGIWYLRHKDKEVLTPPPKPISKKKHAGGLISVFSLGFIRTFVSISGVTATYFAANIISNISLSLLESVIYTVVFLAAAVVPFVGIILFMKKNPERILRVARQFRATLRRMNYRLITGVTAIILGSCILFFNLMAVLLLY
jgi:cytochrome c biogenesis protein CcdA